MYRTGFFLSILFTCMIHVTSLPFVPHETHEPHCGIILDAGSSSTKLRIYSWNETIENVPVLNERFYSKVRPGISKFQDDTTKVATYMIKILKVIKDGIAEIACPVQTPLYLMATAGLRLLDENITRSIILAIEATLSNKQLNPFLYDEGFVQILAGEEEALFAWMTTNYLNSFFIGNRDVSESFGLVELGGGSVQIAFLPEDPIYAGKMPVMVAGKEYPVYCHSHLSYGATMMDHRIGEYLIYENPHANVVINPCMLKGDEKNTTLGDRTVGMIGGGNATLCEYILRHYLSPAPDDMCSPKPCSIGQVYQPSIRNRNFFTFGLIYYIAKSLGVMEKPGLLDLVRLQENARLYCTKTFVEAVDVMDMSPEWASRNCQDGLYVPLLFSALGFELNTSNILAGKDIGGASVAWSLGGMLYEEERNKYQAKSEYSFS